MTRPPGLTDELRAALARFGEVLIRCDDGRDRGADLDARMGEAVAVLDHAWDAGRTAGLAERLPDDLLTAVPLPWRVVRAEDVIRGDDGELYSVVRSGWIEHPRAAGHAGSWGLTLACGNYRQTHEGDPDEPAPVLVAVGLADALTLTREQMGAQMIASRMAPDGSADGDLMWRGEP
jgi:hypothetical protein